MAAAATARLGHRHMVSSVFHRYPSSQIVFFSTKNDRIQDILMNPEGHSARILPGGKYVERQVRNERRKVLVERAYGNFWMMTDLKKTGNKPVLSNEHLISEKMAQDFPSLSYWTTVNDGTEVHVPEFFLRNNRAKDASAQCTLVAIAFTHFGAQLLDSWTTPFVTEFANNNRVEVVHLSITEGGWFVCKFLRPLLSRSARSNTPIQQQSTTLLHYGSAESLSTFKDTLRMHNTLTGYVYLLDGLGRVRFAGSGSASHEEANRVIAFAKEITPLLNSTKRLKQVRQK
jgi:mitochondrial ATPase complex subunit ATP10